MTPPLFSRPTRACLHELDFDRLLAGEQAGLGAQRAHLGQCLHCRSILAAMVAEQERIHGPAHVAEHAARLADRLGADGEHAARLADRLGADGEHAARLADRLGADGEHAAEEPAPRPATLLSTTLRTLVRRRS